MDGRLYWDDLTQEEKAQAELSYLSIMEDVAFSGDEDDKKFYERLVEDRDLRISMLEEKTFNREDDGYIFVNI